MKKADVDAVVVATDDERIFNHVKSSGYDVIMTAGDHLSGTDRVIEAVDHYPEFEIVINVQGDEPMIEPELVNKMVLKLKEREDVSILTAATKISMAEAENPNRVKVVVDKNERALFFSRAKIPFNRNAVRAEVEYLQHIGTYGFKRVALDKIKTLKPSSLEVIESLEQLRWMEHGMGIHCLIGEWEGFGIDTREDVVEFVRKKDLEGPYLSA